LEDDVSINENEPNLSTSVRDRADVGALSDDDRLRLARWLAEVGRPTSIPAEGRRRRRRVLVPATAAAVVLVPWLAYLAATLPDRQRAHNWRLAWVGFDGALMLAFAATAWFGWRGRQIVITAFLVTATLLLCDAWFDVALSWGGREQNTSILTAVAGEIPFAVFLLAVHHRLVGALTAQIWRDRGRPGEPPPLRHLPLLLLPTPVENVSTNQSVDARSIEQIYDDGNSADR
jgi:hypothetical protein